MTDTVEELQGKPEALRPVITGTLVVCLAVAVAPWFSGGQEPVAMLVGGVALLLAVLLLWRQPTLRRFSWGPLALSWAVLIGWAILSLWWSANRYSTAVWLVEWVMAGLVFRMAYTVASEPKGRTWLLRAYVISAAVFSVGAVWIYMTSAYPRLTGWFYWPNPAAAYLIPVIMLSFDRLRRSSEPKSSWAWAGASLGFLATFLLTNSRASMAVLVLVMIIYLALVRLNKSFWIKYLFILIIGIGLSIGLAELSTITAHHTSSIIPGSRFAQAAEGDPSNLRDRIDYVSSGFEMWFARPLTGFGAGTYGDVHPEFQQRVISASTNAHNLYVQTLAELGIVGAVALAAVLLWLFAGTLRGLVHNPEMLPVALGVFGLLLHFGLDIDASYPALLMLVAMLLGLIYSQGFGRQRAASWVLPGVAAVLLMPLISLYQSDVWAARGQIAQANGDYGQATVDYAAAHRGVTYNPDYLTAEGIDWYAEAAAGGASSKPDSTLALGLARQAEVLDPYDAQHHQLEGRVLALRGDLSGAEAAFRVALRLDPYDQPGYALDLATVQVEAGDSAGAIQTAQAMLRLYPQPVINNRNLDQTLRPTLAELEALVGDEELAHGNLVAAQTASKQALHLDKEDVRARGLEQELLLEQAKTH